MNRKNFMKIKKNILKLMKAFMMSYLIMIQMETKKLK